LATKSNEENARGYSTNPGSEAGRFAIASDKVEGTAVYRSNGDKVGRIERVMLDKQTGKVA
jgi:hypothetical protein